MSNKHYTQYSKFSGEEPMLINNPETEVKAEIVEENDSAVIEQPVLSENEVESAIVEPVTDEPEVSEEPEPTIEPEIRKFGKIHGCKKLNVRKLPSRDAEIVSELIEGIEVMIDEKASTALFYKICTEHGIEGYCMKNFIKVLP